jgi:adenylate kinase family enzyme
MMRIVVIGNSGGGKSVLARRLATELRAPLVELDTVLWLPGWQLASAEAYDREHARLVAQDRWIIEGLGTRASVPARLERATHIVLIDMPLWVHFCLCAERHMEWVSGRLEHPPAGRRQPPPLKALFRTIAEVDRDWMPDIRRAVADEEQHGKQVFRLATLEELNSFVFPVSGIA